jgi:hypothetical protein
MTTLVLDVKPTVIDITEETNTAQPIVQNAEAPNEISKPDDHDALHIPILIFGLGDEPYTGKVDTGAQCCSLGATDIKHDDDVVEFTINNKRYRTPCTGIVNIQNAEGTEQRPTIQVSCKVKGTLLRDIKFNLNDRSNMPDQILIGMNLLNHLDLDINSHEETNHTD